MRLFFSIITFFFLVGTIQGQELSGKKFDHFVGVQINQLLNAIINLNISNDDIENPYLLKYSFIINKNGFGIKGGFGFEYSESADQDNPDGRLVKTSDLAFRIGPCHRIFLSNKFELEYGPGVVMMNKLTKSFSSSETVSGTFSDSSAFQTENQKETFGVGIDVALNYYISKRILIGTETSYYYLSSEEKSHSLVFTQTANVQTTTYSIEAENLATDEKVFTLQLPIAVFLIIKF